MSLTSQKVLLTGAFSILDTSQTIPWQAAVAVSPSVTARTRRGLRAVPAAQARGLPGQPLLPQRNAIFQSQWKITGVFNIVALTG